MPRPSKGERISFTVRMTPQERGQIEAKAKAEGMTMGEWMLWLALSVESDGYKPTEASPAKLTEVSSAKLTEVSHPSVGNRETLPAKATPIVTEDSHPSVIYLTEETSQAEDEDSTAQQHSAIFVEPTPEELERQLTSPLAPKPLPGEPKESFERRFQAWLNHRRAQAGVRPAAWLNGGSTALELKGSTRPLYRGDDEF